MADLPPGTVSVAIAAVRLRRPVHQIRNDVTLGRLAGGYTGTRWYVNEDALAAALAEQPPEGEVRNGMEAPPDA